MPIYEYQCKKCREKFELRLSFFHRASSVKCPKCGSEDPERIISAFNTDSSYGSSCGSTRFR